VGLPAPAPAPTAWRVAGQEEVQAILGEKDNHDAPWLAFTPVDFEREETGQALAGAGFSSAEPAFVAWLGVSMYLDPDSEARTLAWAASLARGSAVVFDYGVVPQALTERERKGLEILARRTAEHGEPWKSQHDPALYTGRLESMGFSRVEHFGPDEIGRMYFQDRRDGLRKGGLSRLVVAHV